MNQHKESNDILDDRYDRTLLLSYGPLKEKNTHFKVSFLPHIQSIVYTCIGDPEGPAGQFKVVFGPIASLEPVDFILIREVEHQIQLIPDVEA